MMRRIVAVMVLYSASLATVAQAATPAPGKGLTCDSQTEGGDLITFKCPVEATGAAQRLRFTANFAGGHDDTSASMKVTLNDVPLVCGVDSKTDLFGEDGDVSLECKFQIKAKAGAKLLVGITLLWSHAQYTNSELVPD